MNKHAIADELKDIWQYLDNIRDQVQDSCEQIDALINEIEESEADGDEEDSEE